MPESATGRLALSVAGSLFPISDLSI